MAELVLCKEALDRIVLDPRRNADGGIWMTSYLDAHGFWDILEDGTAIERRPDGLFGVMLANVRENLKVNG